MVETIDREELLGRIESGHAPVLLEILSEESYRKAHLPGAIRFTDLDLAEELLPDRETEIVTYCSNYN